MTGFRQQRHADAGRRIVGLAIDLEGFGDRVTDFFGHRQCGVDRGVAVGSQLRQQHNELVAANARHRVTIAHQPRQAVGGVAQQGVAARIVDEFKVVEVDEHERTVTGAGLGAGDQLVNPLHQQAAVRQARQHVEKRQTARR